MATPTPQQPETEAALEGGSYEVLRARLAEQAGQLAEKAEALNARRKKEFGGQELQVLGTERIRTEHNCVPRDIVPVGSHLLVGTNAFLGLKQDRVPRDWFSLHRFTQSAEGFDFSEAPSSEAGGFLDDRRLAKDVGDLARYFKDARLERVVQVDERLLAVFRTGATDRDVKVFRLSVDRGGSATYLDTRGPEELPSRPTHDFGWVRCTRDNFVQGRHPHVNILDEVFVETIKGDLTVKVENNTESGQGIYAEPVLEADQALDDAEFLYAKVGALILLRIKPFREEAWRHLVFNTRTRQVARADAVGQSCVQLPEEQGVTFPGGYALMTGEVKVYDAAPPPDLHFERSVQSPNGEDVLYVFFSRATGRYQLVAYNLVRKEVATPVHCHGWALYADGRLVALRAESDEPTRVHPVQVWQTPFVSAEHHAAAPRGQGFLAKVGNADLVRGISDALTLARLARSEAPSRRTWEDLAQACTRAADAYYWLGHAEVGLAPAVAELRRSAELILGEFEKVQTLQRRAAEAMAQAQQAQDALLGRIQPDDLREPQAFLDALVELRKQRGQLITLREVRYVDLARLEALEAQVVQRFDEVGKATVAFLLQPGALAPVEQEVARKQAAAEQVSRYADAEPLVAELERVGQGLELLGEVVGGLQAGDPAEKARILESISGVFGLLNRARATAQARRKELLSGERRSEFGAQFKLLGQAVESALALADSPEKCDEQLARLQVQLEELEGRFAELDEFQSVLAERREEMLEAFEARRRALLDERQRRAQNLLGAADRILQGLARRAKSFTSEDELNTFFAADPMVEKLRDLVRQLHGLKDPVKADEVESRLKAARQDALRGQRDKQDLFEEGEAVLKFGTHRFNVNTQAIELTLLPKDGGLWLHLTGTDFLQRLEDPALDSAKAYWDMTLPSESATVYRAEALAAGLLFDAEEGKGGLSLQGLLDATREPEGLEGLVRARAQERFDEGYERGVHDADAAKMLRALLELRGGAGLLRYPPQARAWATLYWAELQDPELRKVLHRRAASLGRLRDALRPSPEAQALAGELAERVGAFLQKAGLAAHAPDVKLAGTYLVEELAQPQPRFVLSREAVALKEALDAHLARGELRTGFEEDLRALAAHPGERYRLAFAWLEATVVAGGAALDEAKVALPEAAALLAVDEARLSRAPSSARVSTELQGLLGQHARVLNGRLALRLDEFVARLSHHRGEVVPGYQAFRAKVRGLLEAERRRMRLEELQPKVLTSFVRNRLIDEVYLPLIGTNLAKQLGSAGENKRTDRMGLLLLISPPGYGKTTLMEYVASRLGLAFVKVNGPALGHDVVSLDPAQAPSATARQEVERINFAFELGNNVMLYLDDVQHTNPELLQKFISLCDAQRKVEGVWQGRTRTYDFRGKKFCVVMAGNPYTESGARFQIPDMLSNRADTYNLGDILGGKDELFALSYLENALTSNPALAPLATRPKADVHRIIGMAQGRGEDANALEQAYSAVELQEMVAVLQRLFKVQRTLLQVNKLYIASASQDDRFRTEPPFKLQGSYRNMNKLAEKVVSALTDEELERLVDGHYQSEAQTLTTQAEQNLLKLAELRGRLTPEQRERWDELKRGYKRVQTMGGTEDDPVVRVTGSLAALGENVGSIRDAVVQAAQRPPPPAAPPPDLAPLAAKLEGLRAALAEAAQGARGVEPEAVEALRGAVLEVAQALREPKAEGTADARLTEVLATLAKAQARPPPLPPPAPPDLRPMLEQLAAAVQALKPAPAPDLGPALEKLAASLRAAPAAPAPVDLGPALEKLAAAVQVRPAAAAGPDLAPVLDRLSQAMATLAERPAAVPPGLQPKRSLSAETERQLHLLKDALGSLARLARDTVQAAPDGTLRAVEVWQHVSQALELVRAMQPRASGRRGGHGPATP